jgi:hypothetical protein
MAVAFIHQVPGLSQEQYEAIVKEANSHGSPPGSIMHLAGPMEGGWRIVDVWDAPESAAAFYGGEAFQGALQRHGTGSEAHPPVVWPLHAMTIAEAMDSRP